MTRPSAFVAIAVLAAATVASGRARADLDPLRAGTRARSLGHEHPPTFCVDAKRTGDETGRWCPLVDDGLDCRAFADACRVTPPPVSNASPSATAPREAAPSAPSPGGTSTFDALGFFVFWIVVAAVALFLGVAAARAILEARRARAIVPAVRDSPTPEVLATPPAPRASRDLLDEAAARERAGDHEGALYIYLDAALRALDKRGAIRLATDCTHGEYVRGCRDDVARAPLREIVAEVDAVKFGGAAATAERTATARSRATKLVRGASGALVVALLLVSRTSIATEPEATEPLGTALLSATLADQGVRTAPLPDTLARLRLPSEDDPNPPAILLDLDRVHPGADAQRRLVAWVRAGGTLIVLGHPEEWPAELGVEPTTPSTRVVTAAKPSEAGTDESSTTFFFGAVATPRALAVRARGAGGDAPLASTGDGLVYATWWRWDRGAIIGVASDELFVDAAILHRQNAEIALTILRPMRSKTLYVATELDGVEGPSSPAASLENAGLGIGMLHALAAVLVLFFAVGARLARARPTPPPTRRAFAEHVEATGLLYARARAAEHALRVYANLFEERLRADMPRGAEPAAHLAHRTGLPPETCADALARARAPEGTLAPHEALALLARLVELHRALLSPKPLTHPEPP